MESGIIQLLSMLYFILCIVIIFVLQLPPKAPVKRFVSSSAMHLRTHQEKNDSHFKDAFSERACVDLKIMKSYVIFKCSQF